MSIDPRRTQPFPTCTCLNKECRCSRWPDYRNRWGLPVNGGGDEPEPDELDLTATTTAPGETVTIYRMTPVGENITIYWGDGGTTVVAPADVAQKSHVYAAAGTYPITVSPASAIQQIGLTNAKLSGFHSSQLAGNAITWFAAESMGAAAANVVDSAHMVAWTPANFSFRSMPAGGTYTINSAHLAGWTLTGNFVLRSMPAGTYTINSAHMAGWTPLNFYMYTMPAGTYTINSAHLAGWTPSLFYAYALTGSAWTIAASDFAGWVTTDNMNVINNGWNQTQVDAVLWGMYQATLARTVNAGTLVISGTNAAPSGIYQAAAACPVTVATPGKEVAHEMINDGCGAIAAGETWTAVTTS